MVEDTFCLTDLTGIRTITVRRQGLAFQPITWMENWDQDFVDEEVEGFFEFDKNGTGEFQFGYVSGGIDYRDVERDGKPAVEFSWDGKDEMDPAQGRGWAVLDGDEIEGRIFIHRGDESAFRAVRKGR